MAWEWVLLLVVIAGGFYEVRVALSDIARHTLRGAESLVNVEVMIDHIHDRLSGIDGELTEIRQRVAPRDQGLG